MFLSAIFLFLVLITFLITVIRPHFGLIVLVLVGPFFTLLHELSPGNPIYFVWPFVLCGLMATTIVIREFSASLARRHALSPRLLTMAAWGLLFGLVVIGGWSSGLLSVLLHDKSLGSLKAFLGNGPLLVLSIPSLAILMLFMWVFFSAMKEREKRIRMPDLLMGLLLLYGIFQVFYTWGQSGLLFTGLDGFRYFFFMLVSYFLARYLVPSLEKARPYLMCIGVACLMGAATMWLELYALNVMKIPPSEMPYAGHMSKNFEYLPYNDRAFWSTGYMPLGFMYNLHMNGLFLLMGCALWFPKFLAVKGKRESLLYAALILIVLYMAYWNSRTVLLLMLSTYVGGALLMRGPWRRVAGSGAALAALVTVTSLYLIPGMRYDILAEFHYLYTEGVSNIYKQVVFDIATIEDRKASVFHKAKNDLSPPGWMLTTGEAVEKTSQEKLISSHSYVLRSVRDYKAAILYYIRDAYWLRGREILIGAWMKNDSPKAARLQVIGWQPEPPVFHSGSGKWEFVRARLKVHPFTEELKILIEVQKPGSTGSVVFLDGAYMIVDGKIHPLWPNPSGFPADMFPEFEGKLAVASPEKSSPPLAAAAPMPGKAATAPQAPSPQRPASSSTKTIRDPAAPPSTPSQPSRMSRISIGRGAQFGTWSTDFFPEVREKTRVFIPASYSDLKYLEYFEQFGVLGLGLLLLSGVVFAVSGFWNSWRETDRRVRALKVGLTLIVCIGFVGMIHLPALFRVGLNTTIYMAMALLALEPYHVRFRKSE